MKINKKPKHNDKNFKKINNKWPINKLTIRRIVNLKIREKLVKIKRVKSKTLFNLFF
jgi:hypothetical protein